MNKLGNFLWRLFSAIMIFSYHDASFAGTTNCTKITVTGNTNPTTKTLCGKGYYLYSCNSIVLGTQWLRGTTTDESNCDVPDYYTYPSAEQDANKENMENLRLFFDKDNRTAFYYGPINALEPNPVEWEAQKKARNTLLSLFCTDDNGKPTEYECKPCPGIATVDSSTVDTDGYNGPVIWDTWNIHTIADCYMKEFSDQFGTYVYKENNAAQYCKYSTHVPGERPLSTTKKSKTTNNTNGS